MLSDNDFSELLERYNYAYKYGKIVQGVVVSVENSGLLVDIKSKACAICPANEILLSSNDSIRDIFKIGETYDFSINSEENEDGVFYLSHKKVALAKNIEILEEKFKNDEIITGTISNIVKGGVIVNVLGVKGFVPSSQLHINGEKVGQELELKILALEMDKGNFILSNKKIYQDNMQNIKQEILDKVELNMVVKGTVTRITDFGAFVDIGGIDALLPLSRISWSWIDSPADVLTCGEKIDVEIIGIDREKQRISLSLKTLEESPWLKAQEVLEIKKKMKGKVTRIKPFGAFVEVYPQVEGLLNKGQVQQYQNKTKRELQENDEIDIIINRFDPEAEKINLEAVYE